MKTRQQTSGVTYCHSVGVSRSTLVCFSKNDFDPLFMFSKVTCPNFSIIKRIGLQAGSERINRCVFLPLAVLRSGPTICPVRGVSPQRARRQIFGNTCAKYNKTDWITGWFLANKSSCLLATRCIPVGTHNLSCPRSSATARPRTNCGCRPEYSGWPKDMTIYSRGTSL